MEKVETHRGKRIISHVLDLACIAFAISAIMNSYLWLVSGYQIPSWAMAQMSFMYILLLQVLRREMLKK